MFYDFVMIRAKSRVVEYAIYSYFEDGSLNDCEDVVVLNKDDSIEDYIRKRFWNYLWDFIS